MVLLVDAGAQRLTNGSPITFGDTLVVEKLQTFVTDEVVTGRAGAASDNPLGQDSSHQSRQQII